MRIYIFNELDNVTSNYHTGGGLVIIARDRKHAERLASGHIANYDSRSYIDIDWKKLTATYKVGAKKPSVIVFRDTGCC